MNLSNRTIFLASVLVVSVVIAYIPIFSADFIWDDTAIVENYGLRTFSGLKDIWLNPSVLVDEGHYWPVVYTTFWIEWNVWGLNPVGFHIGNLLLYILNVLLLWWILLRLNIRGAWLISMLFALHPFHAESVTWTIERKDVLYGLFYLSSFLCFILYEEKRSLAFYLSSTALLVLGMLSKSACVSLPFVLLIYIWWKEGRISSEKFILTLPHFVVAFGIGLLDTWRTRGQSEYQSGFSILTRIIVAGRATFHYIIKTFLPFGLTPIYEKWDLMPVRYWQLIYPLVIGLTFMALWGYRKRLGRGPLACFALFLVTLGPTLGIIDFSFMRLSYVADRFAYLAVLGLLIPFGVFLSKSIKEATGEKRQLWSSLAVIILMVFAVQSWRRTATYESNEGFWKNNIAQNPNSYHAYYCLAHGYMKEGRSAKAEEYYLRTLRLKPDHSLALNNLGQLLVAKGDVEKGIDCLERSVQANPNNTSAQNNLGTALARTGQYDRAMQYLLKAHELAPDDEGPLLNMGHVYRSQGRWDEALKYYTDAWRQNPDNPAVHMNLAESFLAKGDREKAVRSFQAALELQPDDPQLHVRFADITAEMGRTKEAVEHYGKALRLAQGMPPALVGLAWIRAVAPEQGFRDGREALRLAQTAWQNTEGRDPHSLDVLAAAYAELGEFEAAEKAGGEALEKAHENQDEALAGEIEKRLSLYRRHKPFRR